MSPTTIYTLTFNCARNPISLSTLTTHLSNSLKASSPPDLIFLSLQEIAPVYASFIGNSFLTPYYTPLLSAIDAATQNAFSTTYESIAIRNVGMTAIMIFARDPSRVSNVETAGVGCGKMEMGNKGAVGVRLSYRAEESMEAEELTFVAAHSAASEGAVERRNEDWRNIVRRLIFTSSTTELNSKSALAALTRTSLVSSQDRDGDDDDNQPLIANESRSTPTAMYKESTHLFIAGDLNYRTAPTAPTSSSPTTHFPSPTSESSSPRHHLNYLSNDQLNRERKAGRTMHGLQELEIKFPPTYKYVHNHDGKANNEDNENAAEEEDFTDFSKETWDFAPHRWPSWCDRILYLPDSIVGHSYTALPLMPTSDHRAVAATYTIPSHSSSSQTDAGANSDLRLNPPFPIDPSWAQRRSFARKLEIVVGWCAYFTTSVEGAVYALAGILGVVGLCVGVGAIF